MTIGDKIKDLRKEKGLSQEQLAQELYVSRAAVAKWEAGNGIPDIENLKKLSSVFVVSIDELLDNHLPQSQAANSVPTPAQSQVVNSVPTTEETQAANSASIAQDYYRQFIGKKCDVDLCDWNDGVNDACVVGSDERFVYYLKEEGKEGRKDYKKYLGALNKGYIKSVKIAQTGHRKGNKESTLKDMMSYIVSEEDFQGEISMEFFVGKTADVYLSDKHIWSGIFTKDTEIFDVGIKTLDGEKLVLVNERVIEVKDISKIEVNLD